jgi:putative oxidoreductase
VTIDSTVFNNFEYKSRIMNIATKISRWSHSYPSFILLIARVILGIILIVKGIFFISHAQQLKDMILASRFSGWVGFLTAYVTFAHLFGGVFIIIGLFTRIAALLQIPVLLGALFFILPAHEVNDMGSDLILSLIVLGLLIYILKKGSGSIAMEDYLKHHLL